MIIWGTVVNVFTIIIGSLLGRLFRNISERLKTSIMQVIGLAVIMTGLSLALQTENVLILIISLIIGVTIGDYIGIEDRLQQAGKWMEKKMGKKFKGNIVTGFVSATLVFCTGVLSILGSIDSGMHNNHEILYFKAAMDGVASIIFTSTFGIGVIFSAIPVFLYQGSLTVLAYVVSLYIDPNLMNDITLAISTVGGILLMGIGCNVMGLMKVHVGNMLPAIFVAVLFGIFM
ncbi:DUF554 domain-containing protein [Bacillus sp. FJAT-45350]|uniref:DUF554 domain-containing protein n=1 Tax=Bacillus sp. FJAT-45350 TaxID=2011014 RepID=UPI000BB83F29|nr:DUF554 domain-containing protein [Bacillus sp. FJAT-45350]